MLNEIYTSVEEGMFNTESKSGKPEIFLRPKESVHIPFKFLTFKADNRVQPQVGHRNNTNLLLAKILIITKLYEVDNADCHCV